MKQGSIIEIKLEEINKFIYIKYMDMRKIINNVYFPFQFRVHSNLFFDIQSNTEDLNFSDLLFSPLHLTGFKEYLKIGKWRIVGSQELTEFDKKQHHYKMTWPISLTAKVNDVQNWRVIKDISTINEGEIVSYSRCKHLEYFNAFDASLLKLRILIEYNKKAKVNYEFDKSMWDKLDFIFYDRYSDMPAYVDLAKEVQGRLLD